MIEYKICGSYGRRVNPSAFILEQNGNISFSFIGLADDIQYIMQCTLDGVKLPLYQICGGSATIPAARLKVGTLAVEIIITAPISAAVVGKIICEVITITSIFDHAPVLQAYANIDDVFLKQIALDAELTNMRQLAVEIQQQNAEIMKTLNDFAQRIVRAEINLIQLNKISEDPLGGR